MNISKEQAHTFVCKELIPIVKVSDLSTLSILQDDFEALEIALASGNDTLVFAMASYIAQCGGLLNAKDIAKRITARIFD